MIVRAVSSSGEEDSEDDGFLSSRGHETTIADRRLHGSHSGSVFDGPPVSISPSALHGARLAWICAALALVLLLLVDLSAFVGLLTDESAANADAFAILPMLVATAKQQSQGLLLSVVMSPATVANNLAGFVAVTGWIYTREIARHQHQQGSAWLGFMPVWVAKGSPWTLIAAIACFGHLVSCTYVLGALLESNGDARKFWLGLKPNRRPYPGV